MSNKTVYLAFGAGPIYGTDDVLDVLESTQTKATFFLIGKQLNSDWRRQVFRRLQDSSYAQIGNHSFSYANNLYREYYSNPEEVLCDFEKATEVLGIKDNPVYAMLPGRNTWRVDKHCIYKNDPVGDSTGAANLIMEHCYQVYGWDLEWSRDNGRLVESASEISSKVERLLNKGNTVVQDKLLLITYDSCFRQSIDQGQSKQQLKDLIQDLKCKGFIFDIIKNY